MLTAIHLLQIPVPELPVKCRLLCLYALYGFSKLKTFKGAQLGAKSGRPCMFVLWSNNSHARARARTHTHTHTRACYFFPPYIFIQNRTTFLWHIVYCYMTVTTRQGTKKQLTVEKNDQNVCSNFPIKRYKIFQFSPNCWLYAQKHNSISE